MSHDTETGGEKIDKIDPALGIVGNGGLIYVLRFMSDQPISAREFVARVQDVLYDEIGSTGHFRLAPLHRRDLNEKFILGSGQGQNAEYMPPGNNEVCLSFLVREDLRPLPEELSLIAQELNDFCAQTGLSCQQIDVRELYRKQGGDNKIADGIDRAWMPDAPAAPSVSTTPHPGE